MLRAPNPNPMESPEDVSEGPISDSLSLLQSCPGQQSEQFKAMLRAPNPKATPENNVKFGAETKIGLQNQIVHAKRLGH
jgi:hypothetical protein